MVSQKVFFLDHLMVLLEIQFSACSKGMGYYHRLMVEIDFSPLEILHEIFDNKKSF